MIPYRNLMVNETLAKDAPASRMKRRDRTNRRALETDLPSSAKFRAFAGISTSEGEEIT